MPDIQLYRRVKWPYTSIMILVITTHALSHQHYIRLQITIPNTFARMMIPLEDLIANGASEKEYASGEVIFDEGTACSCYFQLLKGRVRWMNVNDEGREYLQALIVEGQSFGELPLFDNKPYAASAIAEVPSVVLRLPKENFVRLLERKPEYHFKFSELLATRLRYKFLIIKEFAYSAPEKRVETLLTYLKENKQHLNLENNQIMLTRQQIADMTGLRVETVIRVIRAMYESHKLHIEKGKVFFT